MLDCILVGIGGFIGTVFRYLIGLLPLGSAGGFPVKTLVINITGSFLISLIAAFALKSFRPDPHITLILRTGVCGGFTTFSTFAFESAELIKSGHTTSAVVYIFASIVLGLSAVWLAQSLVK